MADPELEAYRQAERLVREAQAKAEEAARAPGAGPPPRGWGAPGAAPPRGWGAPRSERPPFPDLSALSGLLDAARDAIPPELARQLADALRELLLALRAVIDFYLERLERPPRDEPRVEDIPIR